MKELTFVESLLLCLLNFDLFDSFTGGFDMNTGKTVISKNNVNYYQMQVGTGNKIRVNVFTRHLKTS